MGENVAAQWAALSDRVHKRVPVSELIKDYLAKNLKASPTTVANYQGTVSLWIVAHGNKPLNAATRKAPTEWLEKVSEGKSRETIKWYVNHMAMLGGIAEFERDLMLERQREGIAKAKEEGKYKGRAPTARRQADEVIRLKAEGLTGDAIAAKLGIGRASVFRILREAA